MIVLGQQELYLMQVAILPGQRFGVDIEQVVIGRDHAILQLYGGGLLDGIAEIDDLVVGLDELLIPDDVGILLPEGNGCIEEEGIALGQYHVLVVLIDQFILMIGIESAEVPGEAETREIIAGQLGGEEVDGIGLTKAALEERVELGVVGDTGEMLLFDV